MTLEEMGKLHEIRGCMVLGHEGELVTGRQVACSGMAVLSEFESKELLARHGIAVSRHRLATSADEAVVAAREIGGPVAVKLCGRALAHKSERGLVRLGLDTPDAVRAAADHLLAAATERDGEVGLLVSEMVAGHRELIAGVVHTEQFGAALMLGMGGVLAEAVGEAVFRLLPVSKADCQDMIEDLDMAALMAAIRGEPAVDQSALIDTLLSLAQVGGADEIEAIDVNPLVVREGLPVAVDALVVTTVS